MVGLAIATVGYTYPVVRYVQRLAAARQGCTDAPADDRRGCCWPQVSAAWRLLGTWGATQWVPTWADKLTGRRAARQGTCPNVFGRGGDPGNDPGGARRRLAGPALDVRADVRGVLGFGRLAVPVPCANTTPAFSWPRFWSGACTASFYGWLPLYLPELFRTSVRATGQGFGFNFGRILAAVGALQTGNLMAAFQERRHYRWSYARRRLSAGLHHDEHGLLGRHRA